MADVIDADDCDGKDGSYDLNNGPEMAGDNDVLYCISLSD